MQDALIAFVRKKSVDKLLNASLLSSRRNALSSCSIIFLRRGLGPRRRASARFYSLSAQAVDLRASPRMNESIGFLTQLASRNF